MKSLDRRSFLKTSAATAAGSFVLPQFFIGKAGAAANSKLNEIVRGLRLREDLTKVQKWRNHALRHASTIADADQ